MKASIDQGLRPPCSSRQQYNTPTMSLNRRTFLGGAALTTAARSSARKPNLVFLLGDDHAGYVLGAHGNRQAVTPNLDRLAAEGTRFAANYCNAPVCTPSRQSLFTGQLPHSSGVSVLPTPLSEEKPTLAKALSAAGYLTAVAGKMHFVRPARPGLHGLQVCITEDVVQKEWSKEAGPAPQFPGIRTKPVWRPFRDHARIWLNSEKLPVAREYEQMRGTWVARRACRFLEEHRRDPFALWVSFTEPHSPFDFPIEDRGKFDPETFEVPRVGPEDAWQVPLIFRDLTPAEKRGITAAYYTSVYHLDRNIGVVLDKLAQLSLENDTLVIYLGDNGYSLGQHGRFEKHCCYEPAIHVPLIMRCPGRVRRRTVHDLTETVDVAPTILDLLGAEAFRVNHGQSLRPYLEGKSPARPRQSVFSEYLENEEACIRTARWKLVHSSGKRARTDGYKTDNPTPGRTVHLFDLKADPGEFHNAAAQHPDTVRQLQTAMLARFRSTHPEAAAEPQGLGLAEAIEWYLRPRDAA